MKTTPRFGYKKQQEQLKQQRQLFSIANCCKAIKKRNNCFCCFSCLCCLLKVARAVITAHVVVAHAGLPLRTEVIAHLGRGHIRKKAEPQSDSAFFSQFPTLEHFPLDIPSLLGHFPWNYSHRVKDGKGKNRLGLVADSAEQTLPLYHSQNIIYNIPVAECV